jgi:hypothetical protein
MGSTPAARLARVKRENPAWVVTQHPETGWYHAHREKDGNQQIVSAPTLAELELRLSSTGLNSR